MKNSPCNRRRQAFTLIELLVVILILGILAALVVPRVFGRASEAKVAKAKADIATICGALAQYRVDNDTFPTTEEGLNALRVAPSSATNWKGPYTEKDIVADPWGTPYQYESPTSDGRDYRVTSYGSDRAPGGEGDAADLTSD